MYGILNSPSILYKLYYNGSYWVSDTSNGWSSGKTIYYPTGKGSPDSEGLTHSEVGSNEIYVCTERDNDNNKVSKMSVLRYEITDSSSQKLTATHEFDLTSTIPKSSDANVGLEGIAYISDEFLVANNFYDANKKGVYDPDNYPGHGSGLFLVAYEGNGNIYVYALDHDTSTSTQLAVFNSGETAIMSIYFDRSTGYLWTLCDNHCSGASHVLKLNENGVFTQIASYARPTSMGGNYNNEGIAVTPDDLCVDGYKPVYWSDDDNDNSHAIREDNVPCGNYLD